MINVHVKRLIYEHFGSGISSILCKNSGVKGTQGTSLKGVGEGEGPLVIIKYGCIKTENFFTIYLP